LGPNISEPIQAYLADSRWYVVRNMLCLLQRLGELPEHFDPVPFLEHEDPRVRREAMPLAMRRDDGRERVLVLALADDDEDVVRMALSAVQHEVPDAVLPTLVNRVVLARERPPELRSLAVKALGGSRSPLALTTLVDLCTAGWSFFGRTRLARPTQDMLVALRTLAAGWADRGEAKKVLDLARRSKDGSIRGAVRLTSSSLSPGSGGTK